MPAELSRSFAAVAVCGCGHEGRLGLGEVGSVAKITLLGDFLPSVEEKTTHVESAPCGEVLSIHCGGYHTIVLTTSGVYGWGMNDCGQLGLGRGTGTEGAFFRRPTRLGFFDAMLWSSKHNEGSEEEVEAHERILQIACGALHSMVLTNRALYACGMNEFGQLGLGHDEEAMRVWTQVCSHRCSDSSARNDQRVLENNMSLILPFGRSSSIVRGVITNVSCGTHHTLLAWRDVVLVRHDDGGGVNEGNGVNSTPRVRHDNDNAQYRYLYYPTLLMAAGKGDFGELGYDTDLYAALRSRDKHVQGALLREATARQEERHADALQRQSLESDAQESTYSDPTSIQNKISNKNPFAGWLRKQKQQRPQRRPEFYSTNFRAVNFELLEKCAVVLPAEPSPQNDMFTPDEGRPRNRFGALDTPSDFWEVVQLQAMHLHSSVTLRKRVTPRGGGSPATCDPHPCGVEDLQTYHWGCYFCGEIEGNESSVPRLVEGNAGITIHAGSEIVFRHRLRDPIGSLCAARKRDSVGDSPSQGRFNTLEEVFVLGQGVLGLGADDSLQRTWAPISGTAHVAAKIVGRTHFLMLLQNDISASYAADSCDACVLGFGDNLHGQIGCAYDPQNYEGRPKIRYSGSGIGDNNVEVLSPRHMLRVGDLLLAVPSASTNKNKKDPLSRGRENVNQSTYSDSEPYVWVVDQIIDVGAGVRHSVFLLNVHLERRG